MSKFALYIFSGGELEEVISGLENIKKYIKKYESSKRTVKKVKVDSREIQPTRK